MIVDFAKNYKNTDYVDRQQIARKIIEQIK